MKKNFSEWLEIFLIAVFPRLRLLIFVPIFCGFCMVGVCVSLPSVYQGKFSLMIAAPEIDKAAFESDMKVDLSPGAVKVNLILDEIYILQSHILHENIAKRFEDKTPLLTSYWQTVLPGFFTFIDEAKTSLKARLQAFFNKETTETPAEENVLESAASSIGDMCIVETLRDSDIIEIRCRNHQRDLIMQILNAYLEEYHLLRNAIWFDKDAPDFFQKHSADYFTQWHQLVNDVMKLKEQPDLIDPLQEKSKFAEQLIAYKTEIQGLKTERDELRKQTKTVRALPPEQAILFIPEGIEKDNLFGEMKARIGEVIGDRSKLLKNFQSDAPAVLKLEYQLAELYAEYKRLITDFLEKETDKRQFRMDALSSVINETEARIKNLNERLIRLNKEEYQIRMLEDKLDRYGKQYAEYETRAIKISLQEELRKSVTTVKVVSPPFVGEKPVWPQKLILVLLAMILGFLFTVFFIVLIELMDDTFHRPEEVSEELNLPVLASFPLRRWEWVEHFRMSSLKNKFRPTR
jgi:uncharacterized protein involved in exopolysaccharide biosynthesis